MASSGEIETDATDFALRLRRYFDAGINKTLVSLRRDGAPRISASEMEFNSDGEVTLGMMPGSMKLGDVRCDPRVALHSPTLEPPKDDRSSGLGNAKMSGQLVEIGPPADTPVLPAAHGRWLASRLPAAEMWLRPEDGHITVLDAGVGALDWLLAQAAAG